MEPAQRTAFVKLQARQLGFDLCGVCPAVEPRGLSRFYEWLAAGYAGQMHYLARRAEAYTHPRHVLDGARSLVVLAVNYHNRNAAGAAAGSGRISRYAWQLDYHDLLHARLKALSERLRAVEPDARLRGVVDTAPLLERELAQLAGLGWIGKNTLLLNKTLGSWFFLAVLLSDLEFAYDPPHEAEHCGTCRACLDACPTQAFVEPYVLDSRRCLSYLTIELRGSVPEPLRGRLGEWVFGCDICQEVCPWNHRAPAGDEPGFLPTPQTDPVSLAWMLSLDDEAFRRRFRRTSLWRARRRGVLRNAALVAGCRPAANLVPVLVDRLEDAEPLVRGACAWALARHAEAGHQPQAIREHLARRLSVEADHEVRCELAAALEPRPGTCPAEALPDD